MEFFRFYKRKKTYKQHLKYKPSDNTLNNTNSNDSVEDNNLNDGL